MTAYFIIAISGFLTACAALHMFRTQLICDIRAKARLEIINSDDFWASLQRFNSFGSFEEMHKRWSCWTYESFYGGAEHDKT